MQVKINFQTLNAGGDGESRGSVFIDCETEDEMKAIMYCAKTRMQLFKAEIIHGRMEIQMQAAIEEAEMKKRDRPWEKGDDEDVVG